MKMSEIKVRAQVVVDTDLLGNLLRTAFTEGFKSRNEIQWSAWRDMIEDKNNLQCIIDEMYDEQKIIEKSMTRS